MPNNAGSFNVVGTAEQMAQYNLAMAYLQSSYTYTAAIANSIEHEAVKNIVLTDEWVSATYNFTTRTITWNPSMSLVVSDGDKLGVQSPSIQLGHEFAHGGDLNFAQRTEMQREEYALAIETRANLELHEPVRRNYEDKVYFIHSNNSTSHTTVNGEENVWAAMWQDGAMYYGANYNGTVPAYSPPLAWVVDPFRPQVCSGYWEFSYSGTQTDGAGSPLPVMTWKGDPVILNLLGGAVETQGATDSMAHFDMQNSGQQIRTGWATAGEGLLVIDRGAGMIDSANDLVASIGALARFDSNNDGMITRADSHWEILKVWVDLKGDAQFAASDLYTLDELNIVGLNLSTVVIDADNHGNTIKDIGTFVYADGSAGQMASVELVGFPPLPPA